LQLSENAIKEVNGKYTIDVTYKGDYSIEKRGTIDVFSSNMGKIVTYDVIITDDMQLYLHQGSALS